MFSAFKNLTKISLEPVRSFQCSLKTDSLRRLAWLVEIACIITEADLSFVAQIEGMSDWCKETFKNNGLLERLKNIDVSSIKEVIKRWYPDEQLSQVPKKKCNHLALDDIRESIEELRSV
uniref:Exonuclease domain-containing protein n=1 Tax=Ditylenchus dipsaci TaxID=166011 RepID=A0A915CPR8_9BILA